MSAIARVFKKFFSPSDHVFLPLLISGAENLQEMSKMFSLLISSAEAHERTQLCSRLQELEHKGDEITHSLVKELSGSFLTFIDREDIHALATITDDIADNILSASNCIDFYGLTQLPDSSAAACSHINASILEINNAVKLLDDQHHINTLKASCITINELEKKAEQVIALSKASLLSRSNDAIEQIKFSEWLDKLESIVKSSGEYAHTLDSIIIKMR